MSMKILRGGNAFPAFRVRQLEEACSAALERPATLSATFVYLLDLAATLSPEDARRACELLGAVDAPSSGGSGRICSSPDVRGSVVCARPGRYSGSGWRFRPAPRARSGSPTGCRRATAGTALRTRRIVRSAGRTGACGPSPCSAGPRAGPASP